MRVCVVLGVLMEMVMGERSTFAQATAGKTRAWGTCMHVLYIIEYICAYLLTTYLSCIFL